MLASTHQDKLPFVLFELMGGLYAVASRNVREIVMMPKVTGLPNTPPEVRGVINLRGKVIKLIDLRVKLGLPSLRTELDSLIQLLHDREQDHRDWLAELEACVRERRAFGMARDPHKCKFGQWYDQFKTEDRVLQMTLRNMDAPHQAIHATAAEALRLAESGAADEALRIISSRRNHELATLIKLFGEARQILADRCREATIVLARGEHGLAFSADLVAAVEHIPEDQIEPMPVTWANRNHGLHCRVGKRPRTNETILLFSDEFFFG